MIRRPIVDLSLSNGRRSSEDNAPALKGFKKGQTRRSVASKRKPNAAPNRSVKSALPASSKSRVTSNPSSLPKAEKDEEARDFELAGCRMIVTEFRKRSCAVYEPVVTVRSFSAMKPLFFRCLQYIESHADDFKPLDAGAEGPSSLPAMSQNLRKVTDELVQQLHLLKETDKALMRLVHSFELETAELFQYQLKWCCNHAVRLEDKDGDEGPDGGQFYMPPWDTAMVKRVEELEKMKLQMLELERKGSGICETLDKMICDNLSSVMWMIEKLSPLKSTRSPFVSSSLFPHPSLTRSREFHHAPSRSCSVELSLGGEWTSSCLPDHPHASCMHAASPVSPSLNQGTPDKLSDAISTSATTIDLISSKTDTLVQSPHFQLNHFLLPLSNSHSISPKSHAGMTVPNRMQV